MKKKKRLVIRLLSVEIVVLAALITTYTLMLVNDRQTPPILGSTAKSRNEYIAKKDTVSDNSEIKAAEMGVTESNGVAVSLALSDTEAKTYGTDSGMSPEEPDASSPITITFCGDILLDNGVKRLLYDGGREAVMPIEHALPFMESDIAMINLELPFSTRGYPMADKEYTFRGDPEHISFLTEMGVDIVSLANNHIIDYGYDAFLDTLDLLDDKGIKYVGAGRDLSDAKRYEIFEVSGKKIAFLSASRVIPVVDWYANSSKPGVFATYDPDALNAQISLAKEEADYVIVYVHWGVERNTRPEGYQINMAHGYIDNGADAVIGSHPHVLQGFEYYKGKPVVYSLGNFVFTDAKKDTMAVTLSLEDGFEPEIKIIPYQITDRKTMLMDDEEKKLQLKEHLESISFDVAIDDKWIVRPNSR